jgi:hypothetical protein
MKTKLSAILSLILMFARSVFGSQATVTGILTDNMCTKKHMVPGKPNADCVRECIKHGAKYVVLSKGQAFELQGKQGLFNDLAGKKVAVTGELKGNVLIVSNAETAQ